ncbi:TlpA family protein disulfide reductase [Polaribacter septentrionalilitoris]|uniref:TlpA family protein disulfide reductase n=1 Tax=Polaribacter septentrionalilitoris TaxID=2494657 RepID=UPI00135AE73E|nr:TlpA disulfide reductase family protein [Polaribacter septentrionalilitoris]
MKKLTLLIILISAVSFSQYTVHGTMTPAIKSDWVILYKIEGARQKFVQNSKIKIDSVSSQGTKQAIGRFNFTLPKDTPVGAYRVTYKLEGAGFVDFIFNKENVSFGFHPDYPNQSIIFSESKENIFYRNYLIAIAKAQQTLDSLQVTALRNPNLNVKTKYKTAYNKVNSIQKKYLEGANGMYVQPFVKASFRTSSPELIDTPQKYMSNMITTFFDRMDFNNKTLMNSSFLIDRITDYVFYINYSDDADMQQKLLKQSVKTVLNKVKNINFKKDVIEFLIGQFEDSKNLELIDYLFEKHYNNLPEKVQNKKFKEEKLALLAAEIGRVAPDFSWKENGKTLKLSTLNDAQNYILVFWSTGCSHCLREIPQLHNYLKGNSKIKVIAFSLETNDFSWKKLKQDLSNWHHVLGLNKWENKTARTYNILSTPSYFVLDANKKIIAKPDAFKDVKAFVEKL